MPPSGELEPGARALARAAPWDNVKPEPTPWTHKEPWDVLRCRRPIRHDNQGHAYYVDQWGHAIYAWPDNEVEPGALAAWERAKEQERKRKGAP